VLLLLVSVLVARGMYWAARNAPGETVYDLFVSRTWTLAHYDLVVAVLIGFSILSLGQAIVSYEVFTGKTLPRRGLRRYWRNAVLLAIGYGVAVGLSQLLATLLMILFYALLSWRSFAQRERYIAQLRPFVASERLYEQLVAPASPSLTDAAAPFYALCRDVLDARAACLVAWGPLAPLVGPPLVYPQGARVGLPPLAEIVAQFDSPQTLCVPVGSAGVTLTGEADALPLRVRWAVPLWSERGLVGVLLLGGKGDGGLYTQEEIEIAGASGERLIDTQASTAMAARLMVLQRQRLAESQVLDRRLQRALHDDILPRLHAAMLTLNSTPDEAVDLLGGVHRQISGLLHEMPASATPEVARLGLTGALQWMVEEEYGAAFDGVASHVDPVAQQHAGDVGPLHAEVLYYAAREAVRNAARHGRGTNPDRPLHLNLDVAWHEGLRIRVEDDGVGLDPAWGTGSGRGQGLALHTTMMAVIGGALEVESQADAFTRVTLTLPLSRDPFAVNG
jgi:signal transduction histidine kinase